MTAITLPNNSLTAGYVEGETGWSTSMNRNLRMLDALVNLRVLDKDLNAPPGSPTSNAAYIIGPSPTGAWASRAGQIAVLMTGDDIAATWGFVTPKSGWKAHVVDETADYLYGGSAWTIITAGATITFGWNRQTASYTLAVGDIDNGVEMNVASANNLTVPPNSSVPIAVGKSIMVAQYGAGQTTIVAGAGVTIRSRGAFYKLNAQYAIATLIKVAANEWYLAGDLA